jgi:teichuronic acid biosynthesis glycosyltransferase TuaG
MTAVSIVTPAYKAAAYIGKTIESVLAQTHSDWEMLVVDDCSPDDTRAAVRAYCERDSRVRLIEQAKNGGPGLARQAAVEKAAGRYVAFLDSDDFWMPRKLERQLAFMKASGASFSFTGFRRISADGSRVGRQIRVPPRLSYGALLGNTAIATSTALIDRERTGPFRMVNTYYDDFALWLEITRRGFPAFGLDEDLMRYRVVGGSVSRNKGRSARMVWRTYREVERLGFAHASWCFVRYAMNATLKYRSF